MSIYTSTGGDIPSTNSKINIPWPPSFQGKGFTVLGSIVEFRNHSIQDSSKKYYRFLF